MLSQNKATKIDEYKSQDRKKMENSLCISPGNTYETINDVIREYDQLLTMIWLVANA